MIDFQNAAFLKLKMVDNQTYASMIQPILIPNEKIMLSYKSIRDGIVFTSKRIIAINVQGLSGAKKDFTSLPYNKIQTFSVETAGLFDLDSELELWFSGLGKVKFEFTSNSNVSALCKLISSFVLL